MGGFIATLDHSGVDHRPLVKETLSRQQETQTLKQAHSKSFGQFE